MATHHGKPKPFSELDWDSIRERFYRHVRKLPGRDACWEWIGFCFVKPGHGQFYFNGRDIKASRAAWIIEYREHLTSKDYICHTPRCNNAKCIRPSHLYKGTHKSNQTDRAITGQNRYEAAPRPKLTWLQVRKIRALSAKGFQGRVLAPRFGVHEITISRILCNKQWNLQDDPYRERQRVN
jgi:hypothetical protein